MKLIISHSSCDSSSTHRMQYRQYKIISPSLKMMDFGVQSHSSPSQDSGATPAEKDANGAKQRRQSKPEPADLDCQVPYFMGEDGYVYSRDPAGGEPTCIGLLSAIGVCVLYASLSVPLSHSLHCSKF